MKQTAMLNKNFDESGDSWAYSPRSRSVSAPPDTRHSRRSQGTDSAWDIGQMIVERQVNTGWGKKGGTVYRHIRAEFPGVGGFSASNFRRMKAFFVTLQRAGKTRTAGARNRLEP